MLERVKENVSKAQERQACYYDLRRTSVQYQAGDLVWILTHPLSCAANAYMAKLAAKWQGPAEIVAQVNRVNYKVKMLHNPGSIDTYHVGKLKPFYGTVQPSPKGVGV